MYGMREKIYDMYEKHITDDVRQQFSSLLTETEDWLYEDGEDEAKSVYVDKLAELKVSHTEYSGDLCQRNEVPGTNFG